jgi:diaminopimelate epimerase
VELEFVKYHGAGNDFILIDDRSDTVLTRLDQQLVARLCDRHFGIGADGLMLLRPGDAEADFTMIYYNADGRTGTLCGNGSRCIIRFAHDLGLRREVYRFRAADGLHSGRILGAWISLSMHEVTAWRRDEGAYVLDTGSPHFVSFRNELEGLDVVAAGRAVRYADRYRESGINVNFATPTPEGIALLTYERGVENETLACGTGVTAAAIAYQLHYHPASHGPFQLAVSTRGGDLQVRGTRRDSGFTDLELRGPAERVFRGWITL